MPYIGNDLATQFQAFATQTITGDGSTGYTLDRAVANGKELLVYINNVKQEEGSGKSYTASGTTITFSEAVASTDSCYLVYMGSAQQTVTAPDASIVSGQIANANLVMPNTLDMNGNELILDADGDTSITADTDDTIDIRTGGSDRIRIDGDGTFIKGVTSAQTNAGIVPRFQIEGSSSNETAFSIVRHSADDNAPSIRIGKTRGTGSELVSDNDFVGLIRFFAGDGTDRASTVADIFCQIDGSTGANDTPGSLLFNTTADGSNSSTERMRIDSNGNVLIGKTATGTSNTGCQFEPTGTLVASRSGDICMVLDRRTNGGEIVSIRQGGTAVGGIDANSSSVDFNTSSDYRLKENVTTSWDATTRLKQLKPVRFSWKKEGKSEADTDGFLAHEVASVVPQAISGEKDAVDADGNPKHQGIDHSKLVALLVKTVQELEARIATLESK